MQNVNNFMTINSTTKIRWTNSFLERQTTKDHSKETDNMNNPLSIKIIEFLGKTLPEKENSSPKHLHWKKYYQFYIIFPEN